MESGTSSRGSATLRAVTMTFSGVASNFAGVPLSFAYMATLGRVGFVTMLLRDWFGVNIYTMGFNLIGFETESNNRFHGFDIKNNFFIILKVFKI